MWMCHWQCNHLAGGTGSSIFLGVRTESYCKAKQSEAFLLGGFNLMAMEGKHSEDPRRTALPQPLLAETKQKTCLSQAGSGHRAGTSIFWNFNTSTLSTFSVHILHHEAELDAYLNLLSNQQDGPCPVYHETLIMFTLAIVVGLWLK